MVDLKVQYWPPVVEFKYEVANEEYVYRKTLLKYNTQVLSCFPTLVSFNKKLLSSVRSCLKGVVTLLSKSFCLICWQ